MGRWQSYAPTIHGGKRRVKAGFGTDASPAPKYDLRFSILEIADLNTMSGEVEGERQSLEGSPAHAHAWLQPKLRRQRSVT